MESLDLKQMTTMVKIIAEEKNLPEDVILDIVQVAIAAAWRRDFGERDMNVRSILNTNTGEATVFVDRTVVEPGVAYDVNTEIPADDPAAKGVEVGGIVSEEHKVTSFGRVAAMTAKQIILQRLRSAERDVVFEAFEDKIGQIMTGVISAVEPRIVRIDLGRASAIMPKREQIEGEYYSVGDRIKVFIKEIDRNDRGAQLIVSRGCEEFIAALFRQEVPELELGTVEIKGIAREAGRRTKIAVASTTPGVDPVGAFVGGRGIRVQAIVNEIGDRERIDIVTWSDNPSEYLREALSPAEILRVEIDGKNAKVFVTEDQQSIAIGRHGQNVRLASKLTGYELDIVVAKAPEKKPRKDVEDSLLSAVEDASEEASEEALETTPEETSEETPAEQTPEEQ